MSKTRTFLLGFTVSLVGCATQSGEDGGTRTDFFDCKVTAECPVGSCDEGYCQYSDGSRVRRSDLQDDELPTACDPSTLMGTWEATMTGEPGGSALIALSRTSLIVSVDDYRLEYRVNGSDMTATWQRPFDDQPASVAVVHTQGGFNAGILPLDLGGIGASLPKMTCARRTSPAKTLPPDATRP